jgi:glutathione S-transferase
MVGPCWSKRRDAEAMIATRAETLHTAAERSESFIEKQMERISRCPDNFDVAVLNSKCEPTIGQVAVGTACGCMDFGFPLQNWSEGRAHLAHWYDEFSRRRSMICRYRRLKANFVWWLVRL